MSRKNFWYLCVHFFLSPVNLFLLPSTEIDTITCFIFVFLAYSRHRYGSSYTIGLKHLFKWKLLILASLAQAVGQIWDTEQYPVTSNAGELALLMGVTCFLHIAQDDLILTAHFADFLHQSNAAFQRAKRKDSSESNIKGSQDTLTDLNTAANGHNNISFAQRLEMAALEGQREQVAV